MPKMVYAYDLRVGDTLPTGEVATDVKVGERWVWVKTGTSGQTIDYPKHEVLRIRRAD